jgi:hypothetical protein
MMRAFPVLFIASTGWLKASAFSPNSSDRNRVPTLTTSALDSAPVGQQWPSSSSPPSRKEFFKRVAGAAAAAGATGLLNNEPASARGRATLEQTYQRYVPRIKAGGDFYGTDFRKLVERADWAGIKNALQDVPERKKEDLSKPDSGVAERARQAGTFSDARVLTAMDLFAGSFSDNSVSAKTKKMKACVETLRSSVEGMQSTARLALGEEKTGGFFGLGSKKPSEAELLKTLRQYYVQGGNAYNEYVFAANDELALKFDKLSFIKG